MEYLFSGCSSLTEISLSSFDTRSLTNIAHMFEGCSNLTSINFGNFETKNVQSMEYMFYGCSSLENIDLNKFNTENVKDMSHMFEKCISITSLDLSNFKTRLVENMENMFSEDINLVYINFTNYYESNIKNLNNIFYGTLENMVLCYKESSSSKLNNIVRKKGCSIVNCSSDWSSNRKIIVATTNKCVKECPEDFQFLYQFKCYYRCPPGTYSDNFQCFETSTDNNPVKNCSIKNYFFKNGNCTLNLQTPIEKRKFIEGTVNGLLNYELYDIALMAIENKQNFIIRDKTEVYQIYSLKNLIREQDLTYIDFEECGKKLKENEKLTKQDDILVFKIEYFSQDFKIPIIEYVLFGEYGTKRLNLYACNKMKINYYIPKIINNYEEYKYNPENYYYNDKCHITYSDNIYDLALKDRMGLFNENNMSLCENMCTFQGYKYNKIICQCKIKSKFNSFLNVNVSKYNLIYRFEQIESDSLNFWVLKCSFNLFSIDVITKNICSIIILAIIFLTFVGYFGFCIFEYNKLNNKIFMLYEITMKKEGQNNSSNNSKNIFKNDINKINISEGKDYQKKRTERSLNKNSRKSINNQQSSNSINVFVKKNKLIHTNKTKELDIYTDNELNYLSYFDALLIDKRSLFQIYFSLIRTKLIFIFTFNCKNDFNPRTMKLSFMFSIFAIFLASNTIFVNDSTLHDLFISNGKKSFFSDISKIGFSIIISSTIKNLLLLLAFPELDIVKIRKIEIQKTSKIYQIMKEIIGIAIIKSYLFFFVNIVVISFIWIYISCFFMIFQNTQIYVIKNTLISFGISIVIPFILYFIPAFFRKIALRDKRSLRSNFIYIIAKLFQIIF